MERAPAVPPVDPSDTTMISRSRREAGSATDTRREPRRLVARGDDDGHRRLRRRRLTRSHQPGEDRRERRITDVDVNDSYCRNPEEPAHRVHTATTHRSRGHPIGDRLLGAAREGAPHARQHVLDRSGRPHERDLRRFRRARAWSEIAASGGILGEDAALLGSSRSRAASAASRACSRCSRARSSASAIEGAASDGAAASAARTGAATGAGGGTGAAGARTVNTPAVSSSAITSRASGRSITGCSAA